MPEETGTAKGFESSEEVKIKRLPDKKLAVDKQSIKLSKKANDRASWQLVDGWAFTIEFETNLPFGQKTYDETTAKSLRPLPEADGRYKYTVKVPDHDPLDPDVIVNN
jgi:hypothetical protein